MYKKVHLQLTCLFTGITAAIMIIMSLCYLYVSESGLFRNQYNSFKNDMNTIATNLEQMPVISMQWLSKMEAQGNYTFFALDNGSYGKGIINVSQTKIILKLTKDEALFVRDILGLTQTETMAIMKFERGNGLLATNSNNVFIEFKAGKLETLPAQVSAYGEEKAAEDAGVGVPTLRDVVKELVKGGMLDAVRGKGGGYRLNRSAEEYSVKDILELTEGPLAPVACLEPGREACARVDGCRTLPLWKGLDKVISDYLGQYTLADLCAGIDGAGNGV